MNLRALVLLLAALLGLPVSAAPLDSRDVPAPLKPWVGWVLNDHAQRFCAAAHDNANQRLCHWPTELVLDLDAAGGRFTLSARRDTPGWLPLPGEPGRWPRDVQLSGRAAPILVHEGRPALFVAEGEHRVQGSFAWDALPESLRVPPDSGLVRLAVNGKAIPHPERDAEHQLWLGRRVSEGKAGADSLDLRVFRRIDDDVPLRVSTQIELDVGGEVREETLGPALLDGLVPLSLSGDLPVRLEDDGRLRVQVRPGRWTLRLDARSTAPVVQLAMPAEHLLWVEQEVWSFQAQPDLRVVETAGTAPVDPRQVGVPAEWLALPAFLLERGGALRLEERSRGRGEAAPDDLNLQRQMWLDFDGGGYTVQDRLDGSLSRTWRLEVSTPLQLGQVQLDQQAQLITQHAGGTGVEVRRGQLSLSADSRVESRREPLPVSGWNTDLQGVTTTLHLPPAWRLLAAPGADNLPDTWLARWTLLDLFLVLVASIAALRLFGRATAALTLLTLALTWHEPMAPRWVWLNLLAAMALLRVLPTSFDGSRLRRTVEAYRWLSLGGLVLIALPFFVQQARLGLHPQLEMRDGFVTTAGESIEMQTANTRSADSGEFAEDMAAPMSASVGGAELEEKAAPSRRAKLRAYVESPANVSQSSIQRLDPNVLTQTGPGLPGWTWRSTQLHWSGPVTPDQRFDLWLQPPWVTRLLGWLSILLITLLALRWTGIALPRVGLRAGVQAGAVLLAAIALVQPGESQAQDSAEPVSAEAGVPRPAILDELRRRLLAAPDCAPQCANWSHLSITLREDRLQLRLSAEAQTEVALPLPVPALDAGQGRRWQPEQVLLDEQPADLRRDTDGSLWLRVPAGRHRVTVSGPVTGFSQLQLPLPLAPQQVDLDLLGWSASGVDARGLARSAIDLARERPADNTLATANDENAAQSLPPLLQVTRTLRLALDWRVESSITRLGSAQGALVATVPALASETVTGESVRRVDGSIQASFAPGQTRVEWTSRIDVAEQLQLRAPQSAQSFEVWRFDVSPLWNLEFTGLPAVLAQEDGWRLDGFRPWPGESLDVHITRPQAVAGQVLTLDRAQLEARPGERATDYRLSLSLRASQGGQHALPLPEGIELQSLAIDGQAQPARRESGSVILPLRPGAQALLLNLRGSQALSPYYVTPPLALGLSGVNAELSVDLPRDRWVLLAGGPQLGPAVLFWGVLAVLLIVAWGLGRSTLTPLRSAQWMLLMLGLSQLPVWSMALVAGWLFALALRGRTPEGWSARRFNAVQVLLAAWTILALITLCAGVLQELVGEPEMQITGNQSTAFALRWFQDRYNGSLPSAWVLSVSIWFYRGLMLLWALWLANSLLNWLRWGWLQYSAGGLWQRVPVVLAPAAGTDGPKPVSAADSRAAPPA